MKENVFDVLLYVFENYMDTEHTSDPDRDELRLELEEAGFTHGEVDKALNWLEGLVDLRLSALDIPYQPTSAMRVFSEHEIKKLSSECRGFLIFLENIGVIDQGIRECVIDRAMALDSNDFDLEQLRWIVLMVLFSQPGQEAAFAWMEDLIYDDQHSALH